MVLTSGDYVVILYRLRVRDINEAIKELGHMISAHTGTSQTLTKLTIMQEAVNVITTLEQQLRGTCRVPPCGGLPGCMRGG